MDFKTYFLTKNTAISVLQVHSYVWNDLRNVPGRVPANLSVPFVAVCGRLGLAHPVISQTGADLWNWRSLEAVETGDVEGIGLISSFTGRKDEVGEV